MNNRNPPKTGIQLEDLKFGDHVAYFYEGKGRQFPFVVPFIKEGLKNNEKCIYIAHESTIKDVKRAFGEEVKKYLDSGQLSVITSKDAYLRSRYFDTDKMIAFVKENIKLVLNEGYKGLILVGEMTWVLEEKSWLDTLTEYETKLNPFFQKNPIVGICQYNEDRFSEKILMNLLYIHPLVARGNIIFKNIYYVPRKYAEENKFDAYLRNLRSISPAMPSESPVKKTSKTVEKYVKNNLDALVLSLLLKKPMCGKDLMDTLDRKTGIIISSGTMYPLLHILEEGGLLKCQSGIKKKFYKPADETRIRQILRERSQIDKNLMRILGE